MLTFLLNTTLCFPDEAYGFAHMASAPRAQGHVHPRTHKASQGQSQVPCNRTTQPSLRWHGMVVVQNLACL